MALKIEDIGVPVIESPLDKEEQARIDNSLFYANQLGVEPETTFDLEPELNIEYFGQEVLSAEPSKLLYQSFAQSLADKPAMMLRGVEVYTPGKALGIDPLLDKASTLLESLKNPELEKKLQNVKSGKLWPVGKDRRWWQVERKYLPEVINSWAANVGDQIPLLLTFLAGRMAGKIIGKPISALAGGAATMITGGPDPSDIATVPAVVGITQEIVKHLGGAAPMVAMEAGAFMDDAGAIKIDTDIAEKYAKLYGLGSGTIEYAQQLWVLGRYSKISKPVQETILKQVLSHLGGSVFEGIEEISQGGLENWLLQKAVKEMKERHPDFKGEAPKITEGWKRNGTIGTGVSFLTGLPGTGMSIAKGQATRMAQAKPETKKFLGEPSVQEIQKAEEAPAEVKTEAKTIVSEEETVPRLAEPITPVVELEPPSVAGQPGIAEAAPEAAEKGTVAEKQARLEQQKAGEALAEKEEIETPEEAKVAEAKLEVEAAAEIEPELYIGNVTARMKKVMGEAAGKKAEDVKGFTEEGFPTKRTKVKMTRGEAEEYLEWLENDLNERLDRNKINTRNQMAQANADWGDIKELRKTLGLETVKRPFTIFYGDQNEIIDIKATSARIKAAVQPGTLQESNMTVGEVLSAVMKRGARFAKMAYATGRTELRSQLRAKARAKKRMNKAIKTIKQKIPRTVDIVYRQAIDEIKATIDPSFRPKKTLAERKGLSEFLKRNPEKAKDIPVKLLEILSKKPLNDYTIEELEQVANEIERLKDLGGLRRKLEISQYEKGKKKDLEKIKVDSVPVTDREMIKPDKIGETLSFKERAKNTLSQMLNIVAQKWRSVATPMDVFFDMLDGTKKYLGANYKIFKKTIDENWSKYLDTKDEIAGDVMKLAFDLGLKEGNYERIGVYAALQQEGGKQKLIDTGYTEKQIDKVKLTSEEMQLYELMREKLDDLAPAIEDVMNNVYNEPLTRVKNYFSYMTDFEAMSDYEIREMYGDRAIEYSSALKKNVEMGFTKKRTGGKQRIKINAMEIFLQHIDNASYLIEMGSDIKRLSEIAATEEYRESVGEIGQEEVRSWLDLMARKGHSQRNKTIPILDTFRKHSGAAVIGFKLSSALVNATPLLDGAGMIGRYAFQGASDIATSKQWREFLLKNFPELRDRIGGDIEFMEFGSSAIEKLEKIGFWALQKIDGLAASSVMAGAYQKYLDDNGLKMNFENPNQDAIGYAQRVMRRTQSSAFFKDVPSAFTRGTLTGNKSVDKLLLQFQSFMLNRWSLIEHDMIRSGIKSKDISQAMNMFFWLAMTGFAEMGLRRLSKEIIAMLTGEELDDWSETFAKETVVNTLQNVPFISQGVSLYNYGNIPVPTLSLAQDIGDKIVELRRTKNPDKKLLKVLELLVLTIGTVTGTPGTMQISEVIRSKGRNTTNQRRGRRTSTRR